MTTKKSLKQAVQAHQQQVDQLCSDTTAQVQEVLNETQEKLKLKPKN